MKIRVEKEDELKKKKIKKGGIRGEGGKCEGVSASSRSSGESQVRKVTSRGGGNESASAQVRQVWEAGVVCPPFLATPLPFTCPTTLPVKSFYR